MTADMSSGGVQIRVAEEVEIRNGDAVQLIFPVLDGEATIPATVVGSGNGFLRAAFRSADDSGRRGFNHGPIFARRYLAGLGARPARSTGRYAASGGYCRFRCGGFSQIFRGARRRMQGPEKSKLVTSIVPILVLVCLFGSLTARAAQTTVSTARAVQNPSAPPKGRPAARLQQVANSAPATGVVPAGQFVNSFKLSEVNVLDTIEMRGIDGYATVRFSLPHTEIVKTATMHLKYHFSPGLLPALSHLKVSLNGTLFATLPVTMQPTVNGATAGAASTAADQQGHHHLARPEQRYARGHAQDARGDAGPRQ